MDRIRDSPLLARQRLFMAGLSLGLVWAFWHLMADFRQNFSTLSLAWLLAFAVFDLAALTADRVWMTWIHLNTHSPPLAMLMHASDTGWLVVLYPATSFEQGLVWQTFFAVALWLAVAMVMLRFKHREAPGPALLVRQRTDS